MCISCARRGQKKEGCTICAALTPKPKFQIVQDIIERHAHVHRLASLAAAEQFRADIEGGIVKCARAERRKKKQEAPNG